MEPETLQTAKLASWPELRNHYRGFWEDILNGYFCAANRAVAEILLGGEGKPWEGRPVTPEELAEACLLRSRLGKSQSGRGTLVRTYEVARALTELQSHWEFYRKKPEEEKLEHEQSFRKWLEKSIFEYAASQEPHFFDSEGPIQKALARLEALRALPFYYGRRQSTIFFPMESFELSWKPKLPTGLDSFDNHELEGGVEEDTLMILAGETNIGKSHLGLHCLSTISLHRHPVLLCSGEDSIEMTKKRVFAHYLHITTARLVEMTERERERAFYQLYGDRDDPTSLHHHIRTRVGITCLEEGKFTPQKLKEKLEEFEDITGERTVAVMGDYLQKMTESNPRSRTARDEELERVVNELKEMSQTRRVFTLLISQIPSHAAGGGNSDFLNLRQAVARSYAATWGAHYIITMNRSSEEIKRLATSPDKRPRLNLFLCKSKDGPLGVSYVLANPAQAHWEFFRTKEERELFAQQSFPTYRPPQQSQPLDIQNYRRSS